MTPAATLPDLEALIAAGIQLEPPVHGVLTDVDDTLTADGEIAPDALAALHALRAAAVPVVAVTGRPVGWSERFVAGPARWPVAAIVAENGAVALVPDDATTTGFTKRYRQEAATRAANFTRLQAVLERLEREIPGARRSRDSGGRETDIAIDHGEFASLDPPTIDRVVALMREAGLQTTVSSIHVNGWIGEHGKPEGARWIVRELWGRDLACERARWVYVGDSTNDEAMFREFPQSVGVANIVRFWGRLAWRPRWVTRAERGEGFAEVARAVLAVRRNDDGRPVPPVVAGSRESQPLRPASSRSTSTLSVRSHVNSGSSRPKWP